VIDVLLAEDHTIVREGLRALLEEQGDFTIVGQAEDGHQAVELVSSLSPHVVVMDIVMPRLNGLEATQRIRDLPNPPEVLILSQHDREEYVYQALRAGARGYLLKDSIADELIMAIHAVARRERFVSARISPESVEAYIQRRGAPALERLTPREREVLQLIAEGYTNRQIAGELNISTKTVEKHRSNLMNKLNIHDLASLVRFAVAHGIVHPKE
jgi:RNA polymerase sigma factor (sigma-70 family)